MFQTPSWQTEQWGSHSIYFHQMLVCRSRTFLKGIKQLFTAGNLRGLDESLVAGLVEFEGGNFRDLNDVLINGEARGKKHVAYYVGKKPFNIIFSHIINIATVTFCYLFWDSLYFHCTKLKHILNIRLEKSIQHLYKPKPWFVKRVLGLEQKYSMTIRWCEVLSVKVDYSHWLLTLITQDQLLT